MKQALRIGGKLHEETHAQNYIDSLKMCTMTVHMCCNYEFTHSSCLCNAVQTGVDSSHDNIALPTLFSLGLTVLSCP